MVKGKYAAKAANRLVQTDNELLIEKTAECERLAAELNAVKQQLDRARRESSSLVLERASELSHEQIASARLKAEERVAQVEAKQAEDGMFCAKWLWKLFVGTTGKGTIPRYFVTDIVPLLITDDDVATAFINERLDGADNHTSNRHVRRHGLKNIQRNSKVSDNNVTTPLAKTMMSAAFGDKASKALVDEVRTGWGTASEALKAGDEQEA
ncbi:hypothetical protein A5761_15195 [Mycolicibacterium setense]|uniref:hypothetical protein n=1 Tax=Mycolicibacterium setense TaxID=431269 RepID=UPI0007EBF21D|nr:hypothetical protein [Mycolicibacterium setense]OBB15082.1 hypothetical protein A5761_15195 [Mycolicibacterium setense]